MDLGTWANLSGQQRAYLAFVLALALHGFLLLVNARLYSIEQRQNRDQTLSVDIFEEPEREPKEELTPELSREIPTPQNISKETPSKPSKAPVLSGNKLVTDDSQQQVVIKIPSINSESFQGFIRQETDRALNQNPDATQKFVETFVAPIGPDISDTTQKVGNLGGPIGGGIYKVRSGGVECRALSMIPQTFDDFTQGTISTGGVGGGDCRTLKKKIDLTDKNGNIKNSDRYY